MIPVEENAFLNVVNVALFKFSRAWHYSFFTDLHFCVLTIQIP